MFRALLRGATAGAAGTTALNAVTYLDMALRGRPPSKLPQRAVSRIGEQAGHPVPGTGEERAHRLEGLGALGGIATGVGIGAVTGLAGPVLLRLPGLVGAGLVAGAAMVAANAPLRRMGLTDPATWSAADWASDALPHLAYGIVTYATLAQAGRRRADHRAG